MKLSFKTEQRLLGLAIAMFFLSAINSLSLIDWDVLKTQIGL